MTALCHIALCCLVEVDLHHQSLVELFYPHQGNLRLKALRTITLVYKNKEFGKVWCDISMKIYENSRFVLKLLLLTKTYAQKRHTHTAFTRLFVSKIILQNSWHLVTSIRITQKLNVIT
jgi:hypothetical protein